jgi:hypothetical protein
MDTTNGQRNRLANRALKGRSGMAHLRNIWEQSIGNVTLRDLYLQLKTPLLQLVHADNSE